MTLSRKGWACERVGYLPVFLWPTGDSYRANAELSLEQEQRLRNNLIWSHHGTLPAAAHTRYLSLLEPCPSQNPNSERRGPVPRGTKNCSGSLLRARSPNQDGTAPFGWLWACPLRTFGLWTMTARLCSAEFPFHKETQSFLDFAPEFLVQEQSVP